MKPWVRAHETAMQFGVSPSEYADRIAECLHDGYVFSTPDEFMAALDGEHNGEPAFRVYMAVGGSGNVLKRFMSYAPEPRPWVIWHRRNEDRPRVFAWSKLLKKAGGY